MFNTNRIVLLAMVLLSVLIGSSQVICAPVRKGVDPINPTVPRLMINVWKRMWLESPVGKIVDNSTIVYNVQTDSMYADIRIPATRSSHLRSIPSLSKYTMNELMELAQQKSFAGYSHASEMDWICIWDREIDYQPFTGDFDIGHVDPFTLRPIMIEEGINGDDYREIWDPLFLNDDQCGKTHNLSLVSLELESEIVNGQHTKDIKGFMVINCNVFIYQIDKRDFILPNANSLIDLFNSQHYSREKIEQVLSSYVSNFGEKQGNGWHVHLSTFPYLEQKNLEGQFILDSNNKRVIQRVEESGTVRLWKIHTMTYNPFN